MRSAEGQPELSVIIPTLNEAIVLPLLLADLAAQRGLACEVLVSDGGSTDGTPELAAAALARHGLAGRVLSGPAGRGRQLNHGAAESRGEWLLFLHADSRLPEPTALAHSLALLGAEAGPVAGRCRLSFALAEEQRHFGYYLCEVKARLGFPATIHGDQGLWLPRPLFSRLGGFREDLPVLEDTLLAEEVRRVAPWRLLPARLLTSPRRFQREGFAERQLVNALLVNFAMIGWDEPLQRLPALYRAQGEAVPLGAGEGCRLIAGLLQELPRRRRWALWYRSGAFVRDHAWQLALRRLARPAFAAGCSPEDFPFARLARLRRALQLLLGHPPGALAAMILTWLWFRRQCRPGASRRAGKAC